MWASIGRASPQPVLESVPGTVVPLAQARGRQLERFRFSRKRWKPLQLLVLRNSGRLAAHFSWNCSGGKLHHRRRSTGGYAIQVGVDVGGTFTDIILERSGEGGNGQVVVVTKVSSTPHDLLIERAEILKVCELAGVQPGEIDAVFHGTTVATNMLIERAGAEVGMIHARLPRHHPHMARHKRPTISRYKFDPALAVEAADPAATACAGDEAHHAADRPNRRCRWRKTR